MQFLQHNWRNKSDIADLRQEVYVRVCEAAHKRNSRCRPSISSSRTARNLLIDRVRREQVVPIEAVADLDALDIAMDDARARAQRSSRATNCAACRPHSTACRRAAARPSCWGASKDCRGARSPRAWASAKTPCPSISPTACARSPTFSTAILRISGGRSERGEFETQSPQCGDDIEAQAAALAAAPPFRGTGAMTDQAELDAWLAQSLAHQRRLLAARSGVGPHRAAGGVAPHLIG